MGDVGHETLRRLSSSIGKLEGHAVDRVAQRLQLAAAGELHAAIEMALGKIAHGGCRSRVMGLSLAERASK